MTASLVLPLLIEEKINQYIFGIRLRKLHQEFKEKVKIEKWQGFSCITRLIIDGKVAIAVECSNQIYLYDRIFIRSWKNKVLITIPKCYRYSSGLRNPDGYNDSF